MHWNLAKWNLLTYSKQRLTTIQFNIDHTPYFMKIVKKFVFKFIWKMYFDLYYIFTIALSRNWVSLATWVNSMRIWPSSFIEMGCCSYFSPLFLDFGWKVVSLYSLYPADTPISPQHLVKHCTLVPIPLNIGLTNVTIFECTDKSCTFALKVLRKRFCYFLL